MENTMNLSKAIRYPSTVSSTGFKKRLARFFKAVFQVREDNPLGLDNAMAARLYL